MKDYQKRTEEACEKLRKQTPTAIRANPSVKSMEIARAVDEDLMLVSKGHFDIPYNQDLYGIVF